MRLGTDHDRPTRPGASSSSIAKALRIGLLPIFALSLAGCDRDVPSPEPAPTSIVAQPIDGPASEEAGPVGQPADTEPMATWTTPAEGQPSPSAPAFVAGTEGAPGTVGEVDQAASEPGVVGLPTPRPTVAEIERQPPPDPDILRLMGRVDGARMMQDVEQLVAFGTRNAFSGSSGDGQRGIGAARDWLIGAFERGATGGPAQLLVQPEPFELRLDGQQAEQHNIIATLSGIGFSKRFVYLVAHYDSRIEDRMDGQADAPGADDNASGVALLLELARVMARRQWDGTIRFLATSAEEQELAGARHHAAAAAAGALPIVAVLNNDMVGAVQGATGGAQRGAVRIFAGDPEEGPSRALARHAAFVAQRYQAATGLEVRLEPAADREGRQGDHLAFHAAGFPAVRVIEAGEDPGRQHNARDTIDRIDPDYLAAVARLNLALAANLALAPAPPTEPPTLLQLAEGLALSWAPVDDPMVRGFWVAWRAPEDRAWREVAWVGGDQNAHVFSEVQAGQPVIVAVASANDLGHASLFGPEAGR